MAQPPDSAHEPIATAIIDEVCERIRDNKRIHQALPGDGLLSMDRPLPFLCVYRRNPQRQDLGTGTFVTAEAAYLLAPGEAHQRAGLQPLVQRLAATLAQRFDSFLILEVWSSSDDEVPRTVDAVTGEIELPAPGFRILTRQPHRPDGTVATLEFALQRIKYQRRAASVEVDLRATNHPPGMTHLISEADAQQIGCHVVGLEVRPIYRDRNNGEPYYRVLRSLSRKVSRAMKKAFFAFSLNRTNVRPQHYFSLGRSSLPRQVLAVDRQLAEVSQQFKFLLLVTPVNAESAWNEFRDNHFNKEPVFYYRPLGGDPMLLKRRLMNIASERVDEPALAHVLRQTQDELDRQLTMLGDIGTRRFLPGSLQVFGGVEPTLLELAFAILDRIPRPPANRGVATYEVADAKQFASRAAAEIHYYQAQHPSFTANAIICDDMYSGLLSTGGNLLIGRETSVPMRRVNALLQHEVGTHLVTYYNGKHQPLRLLQVGLAGYDALQEGIAVLSEYLVGGLSMGRLRTLAGRVVAADSMAKGASFVSTFRILVDGYLFEPRTAYTIVLRVFRGGGLTKDAVYLRGLEDILRYARRGGALTPLLTGKMALEHIPIVQELMLRQVVREPLLRPRYMDDPTAMSRWEAVRNSLSVLDLIDDSLGDDASHD